MTINIHSPVCRSPGVVGESPNCTTSGEEQQLSADPCLPPFGTAPFALFADRALKTATSGLVLSLLLKTRLLETGMILLGGSSKGSSESSAVTTTAGGARWCCLTGVLSRVGRRKTRVWLWDLPSSVVDMLLVV